MTQQTHSREELLKLHWGRNKEGTWAVQGMSGLKLDPRGDEEEHFFGVNHDLVVFQPRTFGTTHFFLGQSVVPIVAHISGETRLRCLGTGFFISCSGLLVTAAHVITDPIERQYGDVHEHRDQSWQMGNLKLGVMIPLNPLLQGDVYIFRAITWATFLAQRAEHPLPFRGATLKLTSDTAICQVSPIAPDVPHQPLSIVQKGMVGTGMVAGKKTFAIGYGEMRDVTLTAESDRITSGDFHFRLHVSTGEILERFPDNLTARHVSTPGPCFSASLQLPAGMSGSPIFDHEGLYVHGVVSKGLVEDKGPVRFGYGSMLAPSLNLPIKPLEDKSLLELFKLKEHGFPKLSGPGI